MARDGARSTGEPARKTTDPADSDSTRSTEQSATASFLSPFLERVREILNSEASTNPVADVAALQSVGGRDGFEEVTGKQWAALTDEQRKEALRDAAELQTVGGGAGFEEVTGKQWAALTDEQRKEALRDAAELQTVGGGAGFEGVTGKQWDALTKDGRLEALRDAAELQTVGGREGFEGVTGKQWDALTKDGRLEALRDAAELQIVGGREGFEDLTGKQWDSLTTEQRREALSEVAAKMREMDISDLAGGAATDGTSTVPDQDGQTPVDQTMVDQSPVVQSRVQDQTTVEQDQTAADSTPDVVGRPTESEPAQDGNALVKVGVGEKEGITTDGKEVDMDGKDILMDAEGNFYIKDGDNLIPFSGVFLDGSNLSDQIEEIIGMSMEEILGALGSVLRDSAQTTNDADGPATESPSEGGQSGGSDGSGDGSSDGSSDDDDGDDSSDDDDSSSDSADESSEAAQDAPEEADDGGDTGGDEGTPLPDQIDVDPWALEAFLESPMGREQRRTEERGIEQNRSGGVTDPPDYEAADGGVPTSDNVRFRGGEVDPVDGVVASSGFGPIDEMRIPGAGLIDPADFDGVAGGPEDPSKAPEPVTDDDQGGVDDDEISGRDLAFGAGAARETVQSVDQAHLMGVDDVSEAPDGFVDAATLVAGVVTPNAIDEVGAAAMIDHADVMARLAEAASNLADKIDTDSIANQIIDQ